MLTDAELEAIRVIYRDRPQNDTANVLLAHIAFQSTVIADLHADLANENQFAAGFRAARELAAGCVRAKRELMPWLLVGALSSQLIGEIASLIPEQYAAPVRQEDTK